MPALDTSLTPPGASAQSGERPAWQRWTAVVAVHLACVVLWELAVRVFAIQSFILPPPSKVLATLAKQDGVVGVELLTEEELD